MPNATGGGVVQADPMNNALIITAPDTIYTNLRQVVDQLDRRRAQVYVEALITEVSTDKAAEIGIQWQAGKLGSTTAFGGTTFNSGGNNILNLATSLASGSSATLPGNGLNLLLGGGTRNYLFTDLLVQLVAGVLLVYGPVPLQWLVRGYSDIIRGIPILVLIFAIYYGLPALKINLSSIVAAVVALSIPLVLAMTFAAMRYFGIDLHKISLGALVLAWFNSTGLPQFGDSFNSQYSVTGSDGQTQSRPAAGGTFGVVLHPGLALDLSAIDPRAARAIDQEIGLNRVAVFVELDAALVNGFGVGRALNLSDTTLSAGLSFEF